MGNEGDTVGGKVVVTVCYENKRRIQFLVRQAVLSIPDQRNEVSEHSQRKNGPFYKC